MKNYLAQKMVKAFDSNEKFITYKISEFSKGKDKIKILDVGCGDGKMTKKFCSDLKCEADIFGLDHFGQNVEDGNFKLTAIQTDLEDNTFPIEDGSFDVVVSNQVIEHILNKDKFLSECNRVLKKGGLFILSTENIASFDNIASVLLAQEPMTQHTGSIYNTHSILSPHFMEKIEDTNGNKYLHKNVCSYFGLKRLAEVNSFKNVQISGFGNIFDFLEKLLPFYCRLITIYTIKE